MVLSEKDVMMRFGSFLSDEDVILMMSCFHGDASCEFQPELCLMPVGSD